MSGLRTRILVEQAVGAGVVNLLLNGAIAWLVFRGAATVPLWGTQGIASDLLCTGFLLPFLTSLITTKVVRGDVRRRMPEAIVSTPADSVPRHSSARKRSLILGLVGLAVVAPVTIGAFVLLGVEAMEFQRFVAFKSVFSAILGVVAGQFATRGALDEAAVR